MNVSWLLFVLLAEIELESLKYNLEDIEKKTSKTPYKKVKEVDVTKGVSNKNKLKTR